jgi:integrase
MSVRKTCTDGARAVCKYGDHRCDHSWKATVKARGKRYPSVDIDEYAARHGAVLHVRTEREAIEWEAKIEIEWLAGRDPRVPDRSRSTVAEALDLYKPVALKRLKVHAPVRSEIRHIAAYFIDRPLSDLEDETHVATFQTALSDGWRPPDEFGEPQEPLEDGRGLVAVNRIMARLRNFVNWCIAQNTQPRLLVRSPFHVHGIIVKTSDETQRVRRLKHGEEDALVAACKQVNDLDHQWAGATMLRRVLAAVYLGARGSELDRVIVTDINWKTWEIVLRTGKSRRPRTLSIDPTGPLAEALKPRRFLKGDGHVFGDEDGRIGNHRTAWETIVLLAHKKITADGAGRDPKQDALDLLAIDLHFHDLRRECASRWWEETRDIWRVSQWLGHGSIAVTQRYLALTDTSGQAADMAEKLRHLKPARVK